MRFRVPYRSRYRFPTPWRVEVKSQRITLCVFLAQKYQRCWVSCFNESQEGLSIFMKSYIFFEFLWHSVSNFDIQQKNVSRIIEQKIHLYSLTHLYRSGDKTKRSEKEQQGPMNTPTPTALAGTLVEPSTEPFGADGSAPENHRESESKSAPKPLLWLKKSCQKNQEVRAKLCQTPGIYGNVGGLKGKVWIRQNSKLQTLPMYGNRPWILD